LSQLTHHQTEFPNTQFPIILVLDQLTSPANLGSIFRLADAFGVSKIIQYRCDIDMSSSRFKRTARNTNTTVPTEIIEDIKDYMTSLKSEGYTSIALEITNSSITIDELELPIDKKLALVIGSERKGVSTPLLEQCEFATHITMFGKNSSMNVAQATGIALFQITKTLTPKL
jgi:tRNA G18 (ribose-2'-O)-methylase SpoU